MKEHYSARHFIKHVMDVNNNTCKTKIEDQHSSPAHCSQSGNSFLRWLGSGGRRRLHRIRLKYRETRLGSSVLYRFSRDYSIVAKENEGFKTLIWCHPHDSSPSTCDLILLPRQANFYYSFWKEKNKVSGFGLLRNSLYWLDGVWVCSIGFRNTLAHQEASWKAQIKRPLLINI